MTEEINNFSENLISGLAQLRKDNQLTNITFIVDGRKLNPCHRSVLAATCPYFKGMFTNNLTESNQEEVELKGCTYEAVEVLVNYLYTGKAILTEYNTQDVLIASSLYQVSGLYKLSYQYIIDRLSASNCLEAYSFSKRIFCEELKRKSFLMTTKYCRDIFLSDEFLNSAKDIVIDLLSSDDLIIDDEETVYEASLSWLAHDLKQRVCDITEVFSHVRMVLLKTKFLEECLLEEPILKDFPEIQRQVLAAKKYQNLSDSATPPTG